MKQAQVVIFTGPTLAPADGLRVLMADYLPPAAQGDIYRTTLRRPLMIGLIDGYFEHVPAVWHKEILWAMRQGIHVFGSSSMGALRAAELAAFGMEGIGTIYAAYRDGTLDDDDEVAVIHGPAENGFRQLSVAMVNIRATLVQAEQQGIISRVTHSALIEIAKRRYYAERSYKQLVRDAAEEKLDENEITQLRDWLPSGQIDQKRIDALAMLQIMGERLAAGVLPTQPHFHFEHTEYWARVVREVGS
ncbi:MAG: TfuA-like protein [Roseiflexaceae bacterium]|nr:TfuA-like protein [Roseiflexaceae bacterium]